MDSGFYGRTVVRFLDSTGCGYVIVAKEYPNIKSRARRCKFQKMNNGWETGEFREKILHASEETHRFVVVRRQIPKDPLVLPAKLVSEHKKNIVKLPHNYHYQNFWRRRRKLKI